MTAIDAPAGKAAYPALIDHLASHPFLRGMKQAHLETMAAEAMQTEFKKGELVFHEGELANRFYLIRSGSVALEAPTPEDGTILVEEIGAGGVLGWSWLFPPYYWHFDARAAEHTTAIFLYGTRLREHCESDPDFGYELMKRTAELVIHRLEATRKNWLKAITKH